ncbi:MAG: ABC transporter permease [Clostridiales bacterium]|nr:ABC transporter permease [Clostridiales bacterium]HBM81085.1 ABC transporter permease [Clostridiaceae bacterium]
MELQRNNSEIIYKKRRFEGLKEFFKVIWANKQSRIGFIILLVFLIMAIFGPILLTQPKSNYAYRLKPPSMKHWLGTDFAGKDTLVQFILGSRDVLLVAFFAGVFTVTFACTIGILSGLLGGRADALLMLLANVVLTMPSFPVTMILSMVIKVQDQLTFGLVLSLWSWPGLAKQIRSQVITLKYKDFIEASRILGINKFNIITKDILPNIISYVFINFIGIMKRSIIASVGLMVLGLVPFKGNHWGMMIQISLSQTGALLGSSTAIYFLTPVIGILLFQLGCLLFATGLDEALNPRLRS